jgi:hypothetical protein
MTSASTLDRLGKYGGAVLKRRSEYRYKRQIMLQINIMLTHFDIRSASCQVQFHRLNSFLYFSLLTVIIFNSRTVDLDHHENTYWIR